MKAKIATLDELANTTYILVILGQIYIISMFFLILRYKWALYHYLIQSCKRYVILFYL